MKKLLLLLLTAFCFTQAFADHLKGGFFTYRYIPGTSRYEVTLTVYMICNPNSGQVSQTVPVTIFNNQTNTEVNTINFPLVNGYQIGKTVPEECVTNTLIDCYYLIQVYRTEVELPFSPMGYTLSYQRCCRIIGISNIIAPSNSLGNTYSVQVPGTNVHPDGPRNSSSTFLVNDTAVICRNSYFSYSFQATDPDGDVLRYSFCDAWDGGGQGAGNCSTCSTPNPASAPPYNLIPYQSGFGGTTPLGSQVTINPTTGLISGIAPDIGEYVVTVCVEEVRNGVVIARNRKELHVKVADCSIVKATLAPSYVNCKDFNVMFSNASPNGVNTSFWDFGVGSATDDTSNLLSPNFIYPDTGLYYVKLVVNRGDRCGDSMTSPVRVYPGFFTGFRVQGVCANVPTRFFDTTTTRYGFVNSWSWDFGDLTTLADTSHLQNPTYTYPTPRTYDVRFIVTTNKGCIDTVNRQVTILDKPPLAIPTRDTLMCAGDTMQLRAVGDGNFTWTPNTRMSGANTANPLVWPVVTTTYTATLNADGCIANDTMRVRVVQFVTLQMPPDTTICLTDSIQLYAYTNGLRFRWLPDIQPVESPLLTPMVQPQNALNVYQLFSRIGHCVDSGLYRVRTVPYPIARVGPDTTVCFRGSATLQGSGNGNSFDWNPKTWLTNYNTPTPTARPPDTTVYVLTIRDSLSGCPKPSFDTVVVNVMPRIYADAGNDTAVVIGQPVTLNATGGVRYQWTPSYPFDNADTSTPTGIYDYEPEYVNYVVRVYDNYNCYDSARVRVRVFRTGPSIFVPTAFTPNGDGKNDVVRPIAVGMRRINHFRIFNRWGQLVFETGINGDGWDGRIKGQDQGTNVFVWVVDAEDYTGKKYFAKGTVALIR